MKVMALIGGLLTLSAQTLPGGINVADPAALNTGGPCAAECEGVYGDCRVECENEPARAHDRHFGMPDTPVAVCLQSCENDRAQCKADCQ
jgi:hypothetical protein